MGNIILHIGFPKTATTTLQTALQMHPGCAYLGKSLRDTMQPSPSLEIARAVFFADTHRFQALCPNLRPQMQALADEAGCLIVSDEAFSFAEHMEIGQHWQRQTVTDHDQIARRLSEIFPGARVMMSVRNQIGFLQSFFHQTDKRGTADADFETVIDRELAALPHRSMLHLLRYDEVLEAYASRFGHGNLLISAFESYKADMAPYLDEVATFCGLDRQALQQAWGGSHLNTARKNPQRASVKRLRRLIPPGAGGLVPKVAKQRLWSALAAPQRSAEMRPDQKQALEAYFAAPNTAFAKATGLDLKGLGYPMG